MVLFTLGVWRVERVGVIAKGGDTLQMIVKVEERFCLVSDLT